MKETLQKIAALRELGVKMKNTDFLLTWEKSDREIAATLLCAGIMRDLYENNVSLRVFDSGLAISQFRDNSTRTRFSFASAANMLGLTVADLDEGKSQIAHGETVRETTNMISFHSEIIGIRDDMYLGLGHTYMQEVAQAAEDGHREGVLHQRPTLVNLQCDMDHPTQSMADLAHLIQHFGGVENLRGKKIAMTWAYSPSYGKPLSVPQGIIALFSRFGMDVALAYPEGYNVIPEIETVAAANAKASGGSFTVSSSMAEAFRDAYIVYPKSWAPYHVMQERTPLLQANDRDALKSLEKRCLENNARFRSWECTDEKMKLTRGGQALYMHCLPADITDVSCSAGEVSRAVFERYRVETYKEASWKPYTIAAMILLSKTDDAAGTLERLLQGNQARVRLS